MILCTDFLLTIYNYIKGAQKYIQNEGKTKNGFFQILMI